MKKKIEQSTLSVGILLSVTMLGIFLNVFLNLMVRTRGISLYLDNIGTVFVSMLGGVLPGFIVGFFTNFIFSFDDSMRIYFALIDVLIVAYTVWLVHRGVFKSILRTLLAIVIFAVVCGLMNAALTWYLYGFVSGNGVTTALSHAIYNKGILDRFPSLLAASLIVDFCDKGITIAVVAILYRIVPKSFRHEFEGFTEDLKYEQNVSKKLKNTLLSKVIVTIMISEVLLGGIVSAVGVYVYRDISVRRYTEICRGVTISAAQLVDGDKVDDYLKNGRSVDGYVETEKKLYGISRAFPQIEYIYCYQIKEDGCHVVFDLDALGGLAGEDIGSVVEFDESFKSYVPTLLEGGEINPIITDDTYGWLLTVYKPIRSSDGKCVAYMAADIQMGDIRTDEMSFIFKVASLYFSVSVIILGIILEVMKRNYIYPINNMADATSTFAFTTAEEREASLERLEKLNIRSGDEIENLYRAVTRMAEDSSEYISEVKRKSEVITKMQDDIIVDFAEMVEARDKCTGDHIKKTSYYVGVIAREMKREGMYADKMTDDYIDRLEHSAPLHDVGKIKISDTILNKPGKLTDEEFDIMKTHTTEGKAVLTKTTSLAESDGYIKEAIEMAAYHHERWDGRGYPEGLKGEEIPLSARIMAVADVFDALVSKRSYKEPFSFDKAVSIITEESGTHFDPSVVKAFLNIAEAAYNGTAV